MEVSGSLAVKVHFAEPESNKKSLEQRSVSTNLKNKNARLRYLKTEGNDELDFHKDMDRMREFFKMKKPQDINAQNIIKQNTNLEKFTAAARNQNIEMRRVKLDSLIKKTSENREELMKLKQKQTYLKAIKKDVQKSLKYIIQTNQAQKDKFHFMGTEWRTGIAMMFIAKHLSTLLKQGRERERIRRKRKLAAVRIAMRFKIFSWRKGPTVPFRTTVDIRS